MPAPLSGALARALDPLCSGPGANRQDLLASLTETDLAQAFNRMALASRPDPVAPSDPEMARLAHERFVQARQAFETRHAHLAARDAPGGSDGVASTLFEAEAPATAVRVIAVGGARGGIGKSMLSASLASALARMGHRVVAVDLDPGSAGLHRFLGVRQPRGAPAHFRDRSAADLTDLLHATEVKGLSLAGGGCSLLGSASIRYAQEQTLVSRFRRLPVDFVVLDLGGDTTFTAPDFFLLADERLVVTTADPTAVLDGYHFVKVALLRAVTRHVAARHARATFAPEAEARLVRYAEECAAPGGSTIPGLLAELGRLDPAAGAAMAAVVDAFRPRLVLNLADPTANRAVIERVQQVCRGHLGIEVELCHLVPGDPAIQQATRRLTNVISGRQESPGARALWALACRLGGDPRSPAAEPAGERARPPGLQARFFQPPWVYLRLARVLAERAREVHGSGRPMHAGFVGGTTGEGPYSLAIALAEAGRRTQPFPFRVWADAGSAADREAAQRAIYPQVYVEGLPAETLQRYFERGAGLSRGFCRVKESVAQRVTFVEDDLHARPPAGATFDLVFVDLPAEVVATLCRTPAWPAPVERLEPDALVVVPSWPREAPPSDGFARLDDGLFQRTVPTAAPRRRAVGGARQGR